MGKKDTINFVAFLLTWMDKCKDNPDREQFCVDFDNAYERDKEWYKKLTGKEWEG